MITKEMEGRWEAKPLRNYDNKYRVVLKFDKREDAMKFIEAWNEVHK